MAVSESACKFLIGADKAVDEIYKHIINTMTFKASPYMRKAFAVLSRCPRGGKTTIMQLLHQRLHSQDINVMSVSFNGVSGFHRLPDESPLESLFRIMTNQLNSDIGRETRRVTDWQQLHNYIGEAPFVLLIDEINVLSTTVGSELARILKVYFLDMPNRYLVVSSHQPFLDSADTPDEDSRRALPRMWSESVTALSDRPLVLFSLPTSDNVALLRRMHRTACSRITASLVAFYGYMPSLIYAVCIQREESPALRFSRVVPDTSSDWSELLDFVTALMTGLPSVRLRRFLPFTSAVQSGGTAAGIQVVAPMLCCVHIETLSWA